MDMMIEIMKPVILLSLMGLIFGLGLSISYKKLGVKQDERLLAVRDKLPGANCGGCGYAGCDAYAAALASGEASVSECTVCSEAQRKEISAVLGVEDVGVERKVARIHCSGGANCQDKYDYRGIQDCVAANLISGGPKSCNFGCIGMGTCVKACPFGAISLGEERVAKIDKQICTGCGACISACPKNLITLQPVSQTVVVKCSGREKGRTVKDKCLGGCIACGLCAKFCPQQAIVIEGNLPLIDYSKCDGCRICVDKCPSHSIINV